VARQPAIPDETIEQCEAFALRSVAGALLPDDEPLAGVSGIAAYVRDECRELSTSRVYAAVNTMTAQPWVLHVDSIPVTFASSAECWMSHGRHELAAQVRASHDWQSIGRRGGRPRTRSADTPRSDDGTRRTLVSGGTLTYPHE